MKSADIRKTFLEFFEKKQHQIVPSAPMVVKNDPTLMFINAGMNQFKDIFLGNSPVKFPRIADTQKCLRVSGKHNDLEEVGLDTYHHTMFEMLGNWSFGDYFKKETIKWGWELLTEVYGIPEENLYASVFEGNDADGLPADKKSFDYWKNILPEDRIIYGSKKDNFWEMGDTGPCGPCSEIHIDMRSEEDKKITPGRELVNKGHPEVIEIWNLVFIEFNRKADGKLEQLPAKHVDTGMGFERLTMVIQNKKSNYDTDIFQPIIQEISKIANIKYGDNQKSDIAMRVIADHIRAIAFAIADGQLPSNNKAGYVIRRILRRAVRYGFTFLNLKEPFLNELVPALVQTMGEFFPDIKSQQEIIRKVITEEEQAFMRTLAQGIKRFEQYTEAKQKKKIIDGAFAFELFDTYGFPIDLTQLLAKEQNLSVDMDGFRKGLEEQKKRSRHAATIDTDDWVEVKKGDDKTEFVGYETLVAEAEIIKFRKVKTRKKEFYQIVLNQTPFYAESGGQSGDRGILENGDEKIKILDTQKEHDLIIHITEKLPSDISASFTAKVDAEKRRQTENNHSAIHLMHAAFKKVLGAHVEQRGSLVDENHLRFDFSHFAKMSKEEIRQVEKIVNQKIRANIPITDLRNVPIDKAKAMGAAALFGEKYGDFVRVVIYDKNYSVELCGGTHVPATGQIGFFKIISESAIAAGIRRIEAITADKAEDYFYRQEDVVFALNELFKNQKDIVKAVQNTLNEKKNMEKQIGDMKKEKVKTLKEQLKNKVKLINGINFISEKLNTDAQTAKDLAFSMKDIVENMFLVIGTENKGKATLTVMISENLVKERGLNAGKIIREIAREIQGGGGGQPHFATAGGKFPAGLTKAFNLASEIIAGC